jgi:LuxR family transcriptional regulator, maltose regulon positive regulatory protein
MLYNLSMAIPILATKLYIPPPPPKIVARPRLIDRLNEGLAAGRKLTLISAPAGFGKSTLVSEWLTSCGRSAAWLSLDDNDNDPVRFLIYLTSALQRISSNSGMGILEILQSPQPPPIESILTTLLNEFTAISNGFILVFDDYHVIDAKAIDEALAFLIEHLPPQTHLVITTREDPSLPIPRLRVRGQMTELRAVDLRFSPAEAAGFFDQMMGLNLSTEDITVLETRTEGWVAGLQLAALAMRVMPGHQDATHFIKSFTGTHHFVMDYLIEEVLQQQSEQMQTFLLRTAILDRLCGSLCDAVLFNPSPSGQETLEYLERANLFIIPLDNERHWYRYHRLFADLLRQRLRQGQTPEEIAHYHLCASEWFERNGDPTEAFRHRITARDYVQAAGLAERSWQGMYESFQSATWLGWVKQLPEELICSRPVLCTQIAWGFMDAHEVDASESRLRDAERCLEGPPAGMVIVDQEQFQTLRARIAFARAYNAQTRRDFLSAVKYAELVYELVPEENQFLRAQTTAILGAAYLISGDLDAACRSMNDWIESALKVGDFFSAFAYAMAEKADILTAQGHLREALRTYQQALDLAAEHDSKVLRVMAHHYLGMAMLYHEMGDDEAADQHLQKSLGLASLHMSVDWSYRRCIAQARLKESAGELAAAIDLLDEAKRYYIKTLIPHTRPIHAIKARIYLKQGRLFKAEEWVNEQGLAVDDELSYLREFEHITLARVLLAEYQSNRDVRVMLKTLSLVQRLLKAAADGKRMGSLLEILVLQALAHQMQGDIPAALLSLERALMLAEPEGYVRLFVDECSPMAQLLREAAARQIRPDYTGQLLARFEDDQPIGAGEPPLPDGRRQATPVSQPLIEPLSQRELEVLRLFATELSGPEIARELVIGLSTVRTHTKSIYSKLNVTNRRAAVQRAIDLDLI